MWLLLDPGVFLASGTLATKFHSIADCGIAAVLFSSRSAPGVTETFFNSERVAITH
jgi:hypothetical protein